VQDLRGANSIDYEDDAFDFKKLTMFFFEAGINYVE
jgi:hypothetical protein